MINRKARKKRKNQMQVARIIQDFGSFLTFNRALSDHNSNAWTKKCFSLYYFFSLILPKEISPSNYCLKERILTICIWGHLDLMNWFRNKRNRKRFFRKTNKQTAMFASNLQRKKILSVVNVFTKLLARQPIAGEIKMSMNWVENKKNCQRWC